MPSRRGSNAIPARKGPQELQTDRSMGVHVNTRAERSLIIAEPPRNPDDPNFSAMHSAAESGEQQVLLALLSMHGSQLDDEGHLPMAWRDASRHKRTVVHEAALNGHAALVLALFAEWEAAATPEQWNKCEDGTRLSSVAKPIKGHPLLWRDEFGNTPLHSAAAGGSIALVTMMLERSDSLDLHDDNDRVALQVRCFHCASVCPA